MLGCPKHKDSYEALRVLAQIKARQSKHPSNQTEALKLFRRVLELNPQDFDANFEIASLFEQIDPKQALIYYEAGVKVMRDNLKAERPFKFLQRWPSSFADPTAH